MKNTTHTTHRLRTTGLTIVAASALALSACGPEDTNASESPSTSASMTQKTSGVAEHETKNTSEPAAPVMENPSADQGAQPPVMDGNPGQEAPAPEAAAPEPAAPDVPEAPAPGTEPGNEQVEPPSDQEPGTETGDPGTGAPEDGGAHDGSWIFDIAPGNLCYPERIGQIATTADGRTVQCVDESVKPYTGVWKLV